jgi:hypothetical protein
MSREYKVEDLYLAAWGFGQTTLLHRFVEFVALREGWSQSEAVQYLLSSNGFAEGFARTEALLAAERARKAQDEPWDACGCAGKGCNDCILRPL